MTEPSNSQQQQQQQQQKRTWRIVNNNNNNKKENLTKSILRRPGRPQGKTEGKQKDK